MRHRKQRTTEAGFWLRVDKSGECWNWTGYAIRSSKIKYGRTTWDRRPILAHRLAWLFETGEMPPSHLEVAHRCDNGLCVRPEHLFLATHAENMADALSKGRMKPPRCKGEAHGQSKFTEDDVRYIRQARAQGVGVTVLARQFDVWPAAISKIARRLRWTHI